MEWSLGDVIVVIIGTLFLISTSGKVVKYFLSFVKEPYKKKVTQTDMDVGMIIGKCENLLVVIFVLLNAYTALAIIFAAKAIVRREDINRSIVFFLAGTLINVTYSLVVSLFIWYLTYILF